MNTGRSRRQSQKTAPPASGADPLLIRAASRPRRWVAGVRPPPNGFSVPGLAVSRRPDLKAPELVRPDVAAGPLHRQAAQAGLPHGPALGQAKTHLAPAAQRLVQAERPTPALAGITDIGPSTPTSPADTGVPV